jgi:hypothetical protein
LETKVEEDGDCVSRSVPEVAVKSGALHVVKYLFRDQDVKGEVKSVYLECEHGYCQRSLKITETRSTTTV